MKTITPAVLDRLCRYPADDFTERQADEVAAGLGCLAPFWLRRSVLVQKADVEPACHDYYLPALPPAGHGVCIVPLVNEHPDRWPLLDDAQALPLCWRPDCDHDARLPAALVGLAGRVVGQVASGERWGLGLADLPGEPVDLSGLPISPASAWVPLAGGLLLRQAGLEPDRHVWSTGAWDDEFGVVAVDGLAQKLALAHRFGAKEFFVPAGQALEARGNAGGVKVSALPAPQTKPSLALADYLSRLGVPPGPDAPFEKRRDYYCLLRTGASTDYYWTHLLPVILNRLREQVQRDAPGWRPTHFVTVVSDSPELAVLGPLAVGAQACLLLRTPRLEEKSDRVKGQLEAAQVKCVVAPFTEADPEKGMRVALELFVRGEPVAPGEPVLAPVASPGLLAVDLTPGTKEMTLTLARLTRPGEWQVYLRHQFRPDRRSEPGTEMLVRYPAGQLVAAQE